MLGGVHASWYTVCVCVCVILTNAIFGVVEVSCELVSITDDNPSPPHIQYSTNG